MTKTFRDLNVDAAMCDALAADGITHPFPIQELTLPLALDGHDLIGQARTGTGKTLAFGLPLLQRIDPSRAVTQALVVVPTRELCLQVHEDLKIGATRGLRSISVYGGVAYEEQIEALTTGVHVVVGTPGRLLDHLNRGNLDLSNVTELVLDEADEMLDMGFLPDVERLVQACAGPDRHTMLFSATMPTAIVKLARRYMDHPTFTRADHEERSTAPEVEQHFFQVHRMDKPRLLARILQTRDRKGVFVFVRTKHMADRLVDELEALATPAIAVHGDLRQTTREKNLDRFRRGDATVLVCTEVAARGLDVTGVTHVVNYDCPDDEKMYLHRIGRTARAGEQGAAVTFAEFNEIDRLSVIRKAVGASESEVVQVFSTSPLLEERFDLPAERPWDHLAKGGSSGGDRRPAAAKGRTDGRPKSDRAREGRGPRHDADRGRAGRAEPAKATRSAPGDDATTGDRQRTTGRGADRGRDTAEARTADRGRDTADTRTTDRGRDTRTGDVAAGDGDDRGAPDRRPRSGEATRTRTRTRSRRPAASDTPRPRGDRSTETRGDGPGPTAKGGGDRGRSRTRSAASDEERSGDDRSSATSSGGARRRARPADTSRRRGSTDGPNHAGDTEKTPQTAGGEAGTPRGREDAGGRGGDTGERGGSGTSSGGGRRRGGRGQGSQGRGRSGRGPGETDDRTREPGQGRGDSGRAGGAREPRRGRGQGGGSGQSSQGSGRGTNGGSEHPEPVARRDARGEGNPQPTRRVKVEHLP